MLLQVAHPLVACGVVEHSGYDRDLWRRLIGTVRALYLIAFGDKAEAEQAGAAVRRAHARVRGTTATRLGPFPAGTPYSASDPELMLWVHATLVHSSLAAYQQFVQPLTDAELEQYHREMSTVAELFGTPARVLPRSYSGVPGVRRCATREPHDHRHTSRAPGRLGHSRSAAAGTAADSRARAPARDDTDPAAATARRVRSCAGRHFTSSRYRLPPAPCAARQSSPAPAVAARIRAPTRAFAA